MWVRKTLVLAIVEGRRDGSWPSTAAEGDMEGSWVLAAAEGRRDGSWPSTAAEGDIEGSWELATAERIEML